MKFYNFTIPLALSFAIRARCNFFIQGLGEKQIFHGTSMIIRPDYEGRLARNATATAANFYCYFGLTGYLSFGWWLPATPAVDPDKCRPDNRAFDWFEYTTNDLVCGDEHCRVHMKNFDNDNASEASDRPFMEEDYVFTTVPLGTRNMEELGWGYFDREDGAFAFGTRRTLGPDYGSQEECRRALKTLRVLQEERNLTGLLGFELTDICGGASSNGAQKPLGFFHRGL